MGRGRRQSDGKRAEMDQRHRDVLIAIIREYIDSAEPVGSRQLSRRQIPALSPATLRNVMADLEEMGYLIQPHTSAGRVPTDKAYRYYVDSFPPPFSGVDPQDQHHDVREGVGRLMEQTTSRLSESTQFTGILLAPPLKHTRLARIDVIPLEKGQVLTVVVTEAGWITARAVTPEAPLMPEELREMGRELTRRVRGRTVQEVLDAATVGDPLDPLRARAGSLLAQILGLLRDRTLYVSGAINILDHPEAWDLSTMREMLRVFEQKDRLVELLSVVSQDGGTRVIIGEENPFQEMQECTLVTSTYAYRDQVVGILGVLGPRRMPYPRVISIVDETARRVSEALSRVRRELYIPS
jgi:heat-inducible transcriptional repressor